MKNIITKSKSFILIRIIFITILLLHSIQNTFAQNVINVFHSGGTGDDYGKEIAYKDDGRYYLTGNFNSTANIFGETLSSQNPNFDDIFISCFDTSGQNIFTKSIGSMKDDIARGIAIDSTGRTYVTGTFNDSLQFADTTIYNPCGNSPNSGKGIFLIKYSPQGNRLWEKVVCGTKTTANSKVLLDPFGKVWLIGNYENGGVLIDTLNLSGSGNTNIFIARFTKNGNLEFANGISASGSGPSQCLLTGITVNNQGAVFISGYYKYANHINGFSVPDGSYYKPFIMKMDYSGNIQWVSGSSSNNNCYSKGFINDISGNSYITGYFQGTTTFGSQTIASNGGYDYFIACCSSSGQWQWAESVGNTGNDYAFGISLNSQNELFITGRFENSLSFAGQNLISNGGTDIFLAKYDLAGGFLAAQSYGGSADDGAYNVYITENDTIIITGYFQNTMTIDTITTTSNGGKDIFVASFLDTIACNVPNSYINIINNYTEISLSTSFQYDTSQYFLTWQMGDGTEFYQTTSIVYDYQAIDTFYISLHIVDKNDSLCFKDFYETVITMCILDELQISKQINNTSVSLETSYSLDTSQYSITWNMGDGTEFYQTTSVEYDYQAIDTFNTILYIEYNNDSLCFINLFETVITNCFLDNLDFSMQMNNNNVVFETSYFIDTNQFQIVWDVGDSTSITNLNNPVHYYNSYGYKSITLSATYLPDSTCNIQIQKILNIDNLPCITTPEIVIHENIDKHAIFELIPNVDTINYQILWDLEYGTIVYDQNLIDHIFPYNYITYLTCQISHIADSNCVITVEKEIDLDCYDEIGFDYWETTDEWPGGWEYHVWADIVYDEPPNSYAFVCDCGNGDVDSLVNDWDWSCYYDVAGNYEISFYVWDLEDSTCHGDAGDFTITVEEPDCSVAGGIGNVSLWPFDSMTVAVQAGAPQMEYSFYWNFGDGSSGGGSEEWHTYSDYGVYTICLTTTNNWGVGCSETSYYNFTLGIGGCNDTLALNYNPNADFNNGSCIYADTQSISLSLGWSIFSTYIEPFENNIDSIFQEIVGNTILVKNQMGLIYYPLYSIISLDTIALGQGYLVKMANGAILNVTGIICQPQNSPILLTEGWNTIGYLRQSSANILQMFSSIESNTEIVKDDSGNIYWPQFNFNNIGNMLPGKGYQVKMISADTLVYPAN